MNNYKDFDKNCAVCQGDGFIDAGDDSQGGSIYIDCPACIANKKLVTLANTLIHHDSGQECPYCYKTDWGKENHAAGCPFAIAYAILDKQDDRA